MVYGYARVSTAGQLRDGNGLEEISRIFEDRKIEASVDEVFNLDSVNDALKKIAKGGSRGKTVLCIS